MPGWHPEERAAAYPISEAQTSAQPYCAGVQRKQLLEYKDQVLTKKGAVERGRLFPASTGEKTVSRCKVKDKVKASFQPDCEGQQDTEVLSNEQDSHPTAMSTNSLRNNSPVDEAGMHPDVASSELQQPACSHM